MLNQNTHKDSKTAKKNLCKIDLCVVYSANLQFQLFLLFEIGLALAQRQPVSIYQQTVMIVCKADDFDSKSRGRSVIWMTWSWLIIPRCENVSHDLFTWTWNTAMNNIAVLTPVMEVGRWPTLCTLT